MGTLSRLLGIGAVAVILVTGLVVAGTALPAVGQSDAAQDLNRTVRGMLGLDEPEGDGDAGTAGTAAAGPTPGPTARPTTGTEAGTETGARTPTAGQTTPGAEHYTPTPRPDEFDDVPDVDVGLDAAWDRDRDPDDPGRSAHTTGGERIDSLAVEYYVHVKINERRERHGLDPMNASWYVSSVSRAHSEDMAARDYFSHRNPDGEGPSDRFGKFPEHCAGGYGENIAMSYVGTRVNTNDGDVETFDTEEEIATHLVNGWMNSTGHRENILREQFDHVGTGVYIVDQSDRGQVFATQNFCGVRG